MVTGIIRAPHEPDADEHSSNQHEDHCRPDLHVSSVGRIDASTRAREIIVWEAPQVAVTVDDSVLDYLRANAGQAYIEVRGTTSDLATSALIAFSEAVGLLPSDEEPSEGFVSFVSEIEQLPDGARVWIDGADELEVQPGLAEAVVAVAVSAVVAAGIEGGRIAHPEWVPHPLPKGSARSQQGTTGSPVPRLDREELGLPAPPEGGNDTSGEYGPGGERRLDCEHPDLEFRLVLDHYIERLPTSGWDVIYAVRGRRHSTDRTSGFILASRGDLWLTLSGADDGGDRTRWVIEIRPDSRTTALILEQARASRDTTYEHLVDRLDQA